MSKWSEFYEDRLGSDYAMYCLRRYWPFIKELHGYKIAMEFGAGIGTIAKLLSPQCQIILYDNDPDMIDLLIKNLVLYTNVIPSCADVTNLHNSHDVDIVYSHGLLEHLSDKDINKVLNHQFKCAKHKAVHYVPTDKYDTPSFGDERLKSVEWWTKLCKPGNTHVFNDGKDLIMIWNYTDGRPNNNTP